MIILAASSLPPASLLSCTSPAPDSSDTCST